MDSSQLFTHLPADQPPLAHPADVDAANLAQTLSHDDDDDLGSMPPLVDVKSGPGEPSPSRSYSRPAAETNTTERAESTSNSTRPRTVNDIQGKTCWICMEDDSEPSAMKWVHPCSCTLLAHEQCLLVWIASKQQTSTSGKGPVTCPQCKSTYVLAETMSGTMQVFNKIDSLVGRGCKYFLVGTLASSLVTTSTILGFSSFRFFFGPEVSRIALGARGPAGWPLWAWTGLPIIPYALILNSMASEYLNFSRSQLIETTTALAPFFFLPRPRAFPPTVGFYRSPVQELFSVGWSYPPGPGLTLAMIPLINLAYAGLKRFLYPYVVEGKRLPWNRRTIIHRLPLPAPAFAPVPDPATPLPAMAPVDAEPVLAPTPIDQPIVDPISGGEPHLDQPPADWTDINEHEIIGVVDEEEFDQGFGEEEAQDDDDEEDDSDDEERELHPFFAHIFGGVDPVRFENGAEDAIGGELVDEEDQPPAETMFIRRTSLSRLACSALLMPIFASCAGDVLLWVAQYYSPSLARFLGVRSRVGTVGLSLGGRAGSGWSDWVGGLGHGLGLGLAFVGKGYAGEGLDPVWWRNAVGGMVLMLIKDSFSLGHMYLKIQQRKTRRIVSRSFEGLDMSRE